MDHQSSNNKDFRFELVKARKRIAELERQLPPQGQPASSVTADSDRQNSFNDIRLLIDCTTEFIWIIDTEKRLVLANEALREHFLDNFTLDMQPGMTSANLLTTEQADYFDLLFDKALHGQSLKLNHSCQNGKTYAVTIQPLKKSEKIIGVSGFARDVSKQSQAQQELRNFEQIVSSTPDMVSLVDRDYRYHIVNDAYLNNFQLRREDIVGKTVASLVGEKLFNEISKPSLDKAFAGEIAHIEAWLEIPVLGRRFLAMTFHPLRGQELSPNFVAIDARDMTDLKRAEEDRQQIFAVSLDMLCVAGFDGYFKELNPAWPRVLGWSIEELKSKPWLDFMAKEDQQITIETGQRLLSGQQVIGFENRIICKDGSLKWMSWNAVPELERQRFVASIRDVTARKQLDDELRQMAMTDPLTGANNRRHFIDLVSRAVSSLI